jgi:hypothetical protein
MMPFNPEIHHRRSIRLRDYDYSQNGAYFVTVVAKNRENLFGEIENGEMILNDTGKMVLQCWEQIPEHFLNVEIDECCVMPNHFHGIFRPYEKQNQRRGRDKSRPYGNSFPASLNLVDFYCAKVYLLLRSNDNACPAG